MSRLDKSARQALKKAIFILCGERHPSRKCLDDIGRRAAQLAGRDKSWSGAWLYTLLNLDTYDDRYNNGKIKYGISDELLRDLTRLVNQKATNGKHRVTVYARGVRDGAVILLKSRKCRRPSCHVHFVGRGDYCSDECRMLYTRHLHKLATQRRRKAELLRRRRAQRNRRHTK